jgi:uncharacterized protein
MAIDIKKFSPKKAGFFRYTLIDGEYLVTNDIGDFMFLSSGDFEKLISGGLDPESETCKEIKQKDFLLSDADSDTMAERYRRKNDFLNFGAHLHIIILTLRCNQNCVYCHASRKDMDKKEYDMSLNTAKKVTDMVFETTSPIVIVEYQGGEPLANFETLQFITDYSIEKNRIAHKKLGITLVSNLSLMDEEKMKYLLDKNITICTSLDGPEELHNKNRVFSGGNAYQEAIGWIKRINEEYKKRGFEEEIYHVDALVTTSRFSLPHCKEIIDTYIEHGIKAIHFRFLNPFGGAAKSARNIDYSAEEYLEYYRTALDYIIDLNLKGTDMLERTAAIFLSKIFGEEDPNFLDLRSPCGAGIGQLAYNYDGKVFTCDEARMLYEMQDDIFLIGDVKTDNYEDIMKHDALRSLTVASCLDCLPGCSDCAFKPYCGVCPIYNYVQQGDIFGQMPSNMRCKINKSIITYLFQKMRANPEIKEIFKRWTINKRPFLFTE